MAHRASVPAPAPRALRVVAGGGERRLSDEELLDQLDAGSAEVCGELYDRLVGAVDGTLYRILGRRGPDHDDLVQSSFEQIFQTLSRGRFARACSLRAWASTVSAHVALNALRALRRERRVIDRGDPAPESRSPDDVERQVSARHDLLRLRRHLAALSEEKATTLVLHDVLGHDLAEIAVLTGVSVAAVQSRLVRGRRELERRLADDGVES